MGKEILSKVPMPIPAKHPLRFAIGAGAPVLEKVAEMKVFINGLNLHPGLKSYISDELDKQEKNGVSLCLHDVEHAPGDFDLHISCRGKHIGGKDDLVFERKQEPRG